MLFLLKRTFKVNFLPGNTHRLREKNVILMSAMYSSRWKLCLNRQQQQLYHLDCVKMQSQGEYIENYLPNSFLTGF